MEGSTIANAATNYPELSAAIVLVIGVAAAVALRGLLGRVLQSLDERLARYATTSTAIVSPSIIRFFKNIGFWAVILLAIALALRLLGVKELTFALDNVATFVPRLLAGIVIIGAGHLLGLLSRSLIARMGESIHVDSLVPRLSHWTIMVIAIVMGLQQILVDITFITQLLLVLVAVTGAGLMLALALGANAQVANLLAQATVRRYAIGERIRIESIEGIISEIHPTGVELVTNEGSVSVPAARFTQASVYRLAETDSE